MVSGPSSNEPALEELARRTDGAFIPDHSTFGSMFKDVVEIADGACTISVRTGAIPLSRVPATTTVITLTFEGAAPFQFEVSPENILTKLGNTLFRVKDLFVGEDEFDKRFSVHGDDQLAAMALFKCEKLQRELLAEPSVRINSRSDAGGILRDSAPEGKWQVRISADGNISDVNHLERLLSIARTLASRIVEVQSPEGLTHLALEALYTKRPHLAQNETIDRAIRTQLVWAVSKETQVCNEIIQNSSEHEFKECLKNRAECIRGENVELDQEESGRRGPPGWMKKPGNIVNAAFERMLERLGREESGKLSEEDREAIKGCVRSAVAAESDTCEQLLTTAPLENFRAVLSDRVKPHLVVLDAQGNFTESRVNTSRWGEWYPGLNTDARTLQEVYDTLPGFPADKVPEIVRKFENPMSSVALPGAVSLLRHDLIHILLGRGLLDQDEAFVIGFTMGTAREELRAADEEMMRLIFEQLYPEPYRITGDKLKAFSLGVEIGRSMGIEDLYRYPIESIMQEPIGEVRSRLGIEKEKLVDVYRLERTLIPNTLETARLPIPS